MSTELNIENLIRGKIYLIKSRNLEVGVYNGKEGFLGIRTKLGIRFLDIEFLGRELGGKLHIGADTAFPFLEVGEASANVKLETHLGSVCLTCGNTDISWTEETRWKCKGCQTPYPAMQHNDKLFTLLEEIERKVLIKE